VQAGIFKEEQAYRTIRVLYKEVLGVPRGIGDDIAYEFLEIPRAVLQKERRGFKTSSHKALIIKPNKDHES